MRTLTALPTDINKPEDVDTKAEDHLYDEVTFLCLARPVSLAGEVPRKSPFDTRLDLIESPYPIDIKDPFIDNTGFVPNQGGRLFDDTDAWMQSWGGGQ
jgi:hypothetical protein